MARRFVSKENLGEAFHVGLRKGCDSKIASAAHTLISLIPRSLWTEFLDFLWSDLQLSSARIHLPTRKPSNVWVYLKDAMERYSPSEYYKEKDYVLKLARELPEKEIMGREDWQLLQERDEWRWLLKNVLESFSDDEWKGVGAYLYN